jgi:two-component sensor histidine kinase
VSLRWLLTLSFTLQVLGITGVVGYLSFKQGQKSVSDLAQQLQRATAQKVALHLDHYLTVPMNLVQTASFMVEQEFIDPFDLEKAGTYFWEYSNVYPNISWIGYYLSDRTGAGAGRWLSDYQGIVITQHPGGGLADYTYATNDRGQISTLLDVDENYDPLSEPWYDEIMAKGEPRWSSVYIPEGFDDYIAVGFSYPIKIPNSSLTGVLGVDLLLRDISDFLKTLEISPSAQIMIIERDGNLIASSAPFPVVGQDGETLHRIPLGEYGEADYQAFAQAVLRHLGDLQKIDQTQYAEIQVNQSTAFLSVMPWQNDFGLDWLVIIGLPKADFMTQINQNNRQTLLLSLVAMGVAIAMGTLIARWLSRPIQQFGQQTAAIAQGELHTRLPENHPIQELSVLSLSLNEMTGQLENAFEHLEEQVEQRTEALAQTAALLEDSNQQLSGSLLEKEILLKEIHHRVKNNLLIVASILNWQGESVQDPKILQILSDSQKRINAMALIHEKLYGSTDLTHIDFSDYLKTLASQVFDSFCHDRTLIHIDYDLTSIPLTVETATPCGLIVNELILNALEHAFPGDRPGNLFLSLHQDTDKRIRLTVRDDGIGFPPGFDYRSTESLGWQLICLLTEQLEADLQVTSANGISVTLTFTELDYKPRLT